MPGATAKYALPYSAGGDTISTIDNTMQSLAQAVEALVDQILPPGTLAATARGTAPTGWALCEGQIVAQAGTYAAVFAAIGTAYNTGGEGAGNFRLPDLRGRVPVGVDGPAARLTASDALGNAAGAEKHTLSTAEMPAHTHDQMWVNDVSPAISSKFVPASADTVAAVDSGMDTGSTGGGGAHNNMPPYQVVNWMIKI